MITTEPHFATRLNSFALGGGVAHPTTRPSTVDLVEIAGSVKGLTALEVNYPEHFVDTTPAELSTAITQAGLVNTGIQVRWPASRFSDGGFSHHSAAVRAEAVRTAKEAVDVCREMGADHVVLWPAHDGYEYPFQLDYRSGWHNLVDCYGEVADHAKGMTVSIEYKPAEPRARTLLSSTGSVLALIAETGRENLAVTLDVAHMFMARENPAQSIALCLALGRLKGLQLNDGWGAADDGLAMGSVNLVQTLEAVFYLLRDGYAGTYYFDTDPVRENPVRECEINIARTKQLLTIAQDLVDAGQLPDTDAMTGGAIWWDALVRAMKAVQSIDFGPHDGPAVCVVGSLNADLIAYESDTWIPGAYNIGSRFELGAGGKGLNVAMSIAATGLPSYLVGRVGNDMFGHFIMRALTSGRVNQDFVQTDPTAGTGVGHVRVNAQRDYDTCVVPGANNNVNAKDAISALKSEIHFSHVVLQFEIPLQTVTDTARRFHAAGSTVVVNVSPVTGGSRAVLPHTDVLVVNEAEAAALWLQVAGIDEAIPGRLWSTIDLLRRCDGGPRDVVVTLGERGLWGMSRNGEVRQYSAHEVPTINAVGAGDSFLAMLVSRLAQGVPFLDSLAAAGAAGALACSRRESWLNRADAPRLNEMVQDRTVLIPARKRRMAK